MNRIFLVVLAALTLNHVSHASDSLDPIPSDFNTPSQNSANREYQQQNSYGGSFVGGKTERQMDRQKKHVENRVDYKIDSEVDKMMDRAFDGFFRR